MSHLEITQVVSVHCNIVKNNYQWNSPILYTFPLFLLNRLDNYYTIHTKIFLFSKTFNSEFSDTEVWFRDHNSKPVEIVNKIKIILVFNLTITYKKMMHHLVEPRDRKFVKSYGFLSFGKNIGRNIGKSVSENWCGKYS